MALTAVVAVIGMLAVGASASPKPDAKTATISMVLKGKDPQFKGPHSIAAGTELRIRNVTDPMEIGPHTFSLVKKDMLPDHPKNKKQQKECYKEGVCSQILKAHQVDIKTDEVGRNPVRAGKEGWDSSFGKRGDSWVTQAKGETFSQKLSAKPGTKLYYMCIVHPWMQGKIKVK